MITACKCDKCFLDIDNDYSKAHTKYRSHDVKYKVGGARVNMIKGDVV